ncbi:MAG: tRNA pseudouridine(55) synthase TruB [bacterium]
MDGILPIYKPVGMTSYDVIREFKLHITRTVPDKYKIGHGGTLDPFAEGVLLLLLGKATKKMNELAKLPKTYRATAVLGARSDTLDRTGKIEQCHSVTVSQNQIEVAAKELVGEIEQEIPEYSAAKVKGVPRYKLARRGIEQEKKTKKVTIYDLRLSTYLENRVTFETTVSSGTYIRQLSYDLFKSLGVESYLESLTRTRIGDFSIEKCCKIDSFETLRDDPSKSIQTL